MGFIVLTFDYQLVVGDVPQHVQQSDLGNMSQRLGQRLLDTHQQVDWANALFIAFKISLVTRLSQLLSQEAYAALAAAFRVKACVYSFAEGLGIGCHPLGYDQIMFCYVLVLFQVEKLLVEYGPCKLLIICKHLFVVFFYVFIIVVSQVNLTSSIADLFICFIYLLEQGFHSILTKEAMARSIQHVENLEDGFLEVGILQLLLGLRVVLFQVLHQRTQFDSQLVLGRCLIVGGLNFINGIMLSIQAL